MRVVVTGAAHGIGKAIVKKFVDSGHKVFAIDIDKDMGHMPDGVTCYVADVADYNSLPDIPYVDILINNAGVQHSGRDMEVNFFGLAYTTQKYGLQPEIVSILNMASVSAHNGAEFPIYCASKGAVLSYTKWTAQEVAKYGATCNSLSCGGVLTGLNDPVINDKQCWNQIMDVTPLKKWATPEEIAEWAYFMTVVNRSCTGQDVIIDNGETSATHFVWPS